MSIAEPTTDRHHELVWCEVPLIRWVCIVAIVGCGGATVAAQTSKAKQAAEAPVERARRIVPALQERHDQQLRSGLVDAATQTATELEKLTAAQSEKCDRYRKALDIAKQGRPLTAAQRKDLSVTDEFTRECMFPDRGLTRRRIAADAWSRELFFVEPVLMKSSDADVGFTPPTSLANATLLEVSGLEASELGEMETVWERMLSTAQQSAEPKPGDMTLALGGLRQIAERRGDIPAAMGYVQSEIAFLEGRFGADSVQLCSSLWQMAMLLVSSNEPERAIDAAGRCLRIAAPRGESSLTYASALNNLGIIQHRTGAVDRALDSYHKSLEILQQNPTAYRLPVFPPVDSGSPSSTIVSVALNAYDLPLVRVHANLGLAYWQLGDVAQAVRHLQIAREQMRTEGEEYVTETGAVRSMATLASELDMFLTVERAARASLPDVPLVALPMLLERKGFALETKATTVKALADSPMRLREYRSLLAARSGLARSAKSTPGELDAQRTTASGIDFQIQALEVEAKERSQQAARAAPVVSDRRQKEYNKALSEASIKRFKEFSKRAADSADSRSRVESLQGLSKQAMADIAPRFQDVVDALQRQQDGRGARESLLQRIQAKLPESTALLEIVRFRPFDVHASTALARWGSDRYGAYLVKRTGTAVFVDYGEAGPIDELVTEFRRTLARPRGTLAHDLGRRLDAALMQPLRAGLGAADVIYVSPDSLLNLLPFGALVDEHDRYLIETLTFSYLSSGRDLTRETPRPARLGRPVIIADPAFDDGARMAARSNNGPPETRAIADQRFERLSGTAAEAQAITALLSNPIVLTGDRATESALKGIPAPRALHVATHGFFLADQNQAAALAPGGSAGLEDPMLRSGLVFAGVVAGHSGTDDGILTALEAAGLDLAGTQLVVLSACETGVGEIRTGEGVFGLRRAFMVAGAETLVMSLWQVDDVATQQLMVEFYRRLAKGEGRAEALRQASLTMLRDPAHRHPFYWASFISTGEPGPMRP